MKHPSEPAQILHEERLIKPQFMPERIHLRLADHDIFITGNHLPHHIPRCEHDQAKRNKADP